jgi:hypothetical protein
VLTNDAGCIALLDASRETCAKDKRAATDCVDAACFGTCFSRADATEDDKYACSNGAALGGCRAFAERDVVCRAAIVGNHSPAEACLDVVSDAGFRAIARAFCGT